MSKRRSSLDLDSPSESIESSSSSQSAPVRASGRVRKKAKLEKEEAEPLKEGNSPSAKKAKQSASRVSKSPAAKKSASTKSKKETRASPSPSSSPLPKKRAAKRKVAEEEDDDIPHQPLVIDNNGLSVIFSFLNMSDFLSCVRVSPQWHRVGSMRTAWPIMNVNNLIRMIQSDDYDNPENRRLRIQIDWYKDKMASFMTNPICRHVTDIELTLGDGDRFFYLPRGMPIAETTFDRLAAFTGLTALNLRGPKELFQAEDMKGSMKKLFGSTLKDRLQMLTLSSDKDRRISFLFEPYLTELTNLRALVLDASLTPSTLLQFTRLEYLHTPYRYSMGGTLLKSVSELSSRHSLRAVTLSMSLCYGHPVDADLQTLALSGSRLRMIGIYGFAIQADTLSVLSRIPTMESITCEMTDVEMPTISSDFTRLKELRITYKSRSFHGRQTNLTDLKELFTPSTSVELLKFVGDTSGYAWKMPPIILTHKCLQHYGAMFPNLTDLTLHHIVLAHDEKNLPLTPLLDLKQLRRLDLGLTPQMNLSQLTPIISQLPHFRTLEVTAYPRDISPANLTGGLQQCVEAMSIPAHIVYDIIVAPHWHTLRVHLVSLSIRQSGDAKIIANSWNPGTTKGVPSMKQLSKTLTPSQLTYASHRLQQFRLFRHAEKGGVKCFAPVHSTSGTLTWELQSQY